MHTCVAQASVGWFCLPNIHHSIGDDASMMIDLCNRRIAMNILQVVELISLPLYLLHVSW